MRGAKIRQKYEELLDAAEKTVRAISRAVRAICCVIPSLFLFSPIARAGDPWLTFPRSELTIGLPEGWELVSKHFTGEIDWARFRNSHESALLIVDAYVAEKAARYYWDVADWIASLISDASSSDLTRGGWWNQGYGATEDISKRSSSTISLGSGEKATLLRTEFQMQGHRQAAAFISFTRTAGAQTFWYAVIVLNYGAFNNLDNAIYDAAEGVKG